MICGRTNRGLYLQFVITVVQKQYALGNSRTLNLALFLGWQYVVCYSVVILGSGCDDFTQLQV